MFSINFFAVLDDEISPEDDDADPYVDEQVEQNDDLDDIQGIWWLHVLTFWSIWEMCSFWSIYGTYVISKTSQIVT